MSNQDHAARLRELAEQEKGMASVLPAGTMHALCLSDAATFIAGADALERVAVLERELAEVLDEPQPPTSQWRPIAEAEGSEESLMVGGYLYGDWTRTWGPYKEAVRYGYTHYLPLPEPPAREGE